MGSYKTDLDEEHPYPHMGKILSARIKTAGLRHSDIQKKLRLNRNAVNGYTNNRSLQAGILWNVGMAIKHNFFAEMGKLMPVPFHDADAEKTSSDKDAQIAERDQKISDLEKELAIYKAIVFRDTK